MSVLDRLRSTEVSPRTAAISIGVLLVISVGAGIMVKNAVSRTPDRGDRPSVSAPAESRSVDVDITERGTGKAEVEPKEVASASEDRYSVIGERNLFRPVKPGAVPPKPSVESGSAPSPGDSKPPVPKPDTDKPPTPPAGQPKPSGGDTSEVKKNLAFTGVVEMPSGCQALLENLQTKETRYVGEGDTAFGCRLVSIADKSVTLDKDGSEFTLDLGENKPDTDPGAKPSSDDKKPPNGQPK